MKRDVIMVAVGRGGGISLIKSVSEISPSAAGPTQNDISRVASLYFLSFDPVLLHG